MSTACAVCTRPTGGGITLCGTCGTRLRDALREVPRIAADILTSRTNRTASTITIHRGRMERSMPIRPDAGVGLDRREDAMRRAIVRAARVIAEAEQLDLRADLSGRRVHAATTEAKAARNPDPAALTDQPIAVYELAATWLADHMQQVRRHPAAAAMHSAITEAIHAARTATDAHRPRAYKGPCPECGTGLYVEPDTEVATCQRCRAQHDARNLDAANLDRARDTLVTIPEAIRLLDTLGHRVPRSTVYRWRTDQRITARGFRHDDRITDRQADPRDPAVYRLGDILDAATKAPA